VTTLSLGAYATLLVLRWKRNRFRVRPADVLRLLEAPQPPLILDVRDAATYAKSPVRIPRSQHITPQALEAGAARLDVQPDRTVVAYCT
jgi:rhodanese-related sulfurtransferase